MGSKVNPNHELRCYSAARPYVELFPPHASCGMYNVSQASSATGFIRPVHTHCIDSTRPNNTSVIFLTHSVNVRRRRWYFWIALSFFLLSASANPVTHLDGSITHDCLTRIWDLGFHRVENQNRSIQREWKCSRVDNNKSIPAQYDSQWFMLKDILTFSFLVLERAFKE